MRFVTPVKVTPALSAYLDLMRFGAALAVLLGHMDEDGLYMSWMPLSSFNHAAVIVFFVLSGFIICATTLDRPGGVRAYAVARLSRIYSVVIPAIAFCTAIGGVVMVLLPDWGAQMSNYRKVAVADLVSSLLFLNESWGNSTTLTLNTPYWSLCYEVWFYVLFGIFIYCRGGRRWAMLIIAALIAGPRILILFPVWLLGAALAAYGSRIGQFSRVGAVMLFLGTILAVCGIALTETDASLRKTLHDIVPGFWRLQGSQRFVTDYLLGIAVAANILAFTQLGSARMLVNLKRPLTYLAGSSFTLYLFHRPMTQILGVWLPNANQSVPYSIFALLLIVGLCLLISYGTERRLATWRRGFSLLIDQIFPPTPSGRGSVPL